jgi:hypothetical protein
MCGNDQVYNQKRGAKRAAQQIYEQISLAFGSKQRQPIALTASNTDDD